jgi:hypothetical protein
MVSILPSKCNLLCLLFSLEIRNMILGSLESRVCVAQNCACNLPLKECVNDAMFNVFWAEMQLLELAEMQIKNLTEIVFTHIP